MEVKILKGGKIVGRYDDKANEMTTDDQRLAVIPHNGVTAINGSTDEPERNAPGRGQAR